jgi:hypothetical protein
MSFDSEIGRLQQAWDLAWQIRFCPPDQLILEGTLTPQAEAHLKSCPICRRRQAMEGVSLPGLIIGGAALETAPGGIEDSEPRAGQVRTLKPELAGWGPKERFYNPPVVLVLDAARSLPGGVLVAQCYQDLTFMAEDDVQIGASRFAEPWNVYTLHQDYLGPVLDVVNEGIVPQVAQASQAVAADLPLWSAHFVFRQMEIELGCFFSAGAMFALMEEYERLAEAPAEEISAAAGGPTAQPTKQPQVTWLSQIPDDLPACLKGLGLQMPLDPQAAKPADLYFLVEAADQMDLAAADADSARLVPVVAFRISQGRPVAYENLKAQLTDLIRSPKLILGGKLMAKLDDEENWQAEFRWLADDGSLLKSRASHVRWQKSEPTWFWASFDVDAAGVEDIEKRFQLRLFSELRMQ